MSVRVSEARLPVNVDVMPQGLTPEDRADWLTTGPSVEPRELGQAVQVGAHTLISELASPIRPEWPNTYTLFVTDSSEPQQYSWRVFRDDRLIREEVSVTPSSTWTDVFRDDELVVSEETEFGVFSWTPTEEGEYLITVDLGGPAVPLGLRQRVQRHATDEWLVDDFVHELARTMVVPVGPGSAGANLAASLVSAGNLQASRELIQDFWGEVFEAAQNTDADGNGVPARLLAAILYNEIFSRPKIYSTCRPWQVGPAAAHVRTTEIERIARELNGEDSYIWTSIDTSTIGAGQIKASTAAMVLGYLDWRDLPEDSEARPAVTSQIDAEFEQLPVAQKVDLFNRLRFPRSNIDIAARLLARLKNRPHRWPNTPSGELCDDQHAVEILATEYNIGATATPAENAGPNHNGPKIWRNVNAPYIVPYFGATGYVPALYDDQDLKPGDSGQRVGDLQNDLLELGFKCVGDVDNGYGIRAEWAVRELQIAMKMQHVAVEVNPGDPATTDRIRTLNLYPYGGPVDGAVGYETRRRIRAWKVLRLRAPVVISAWSMSQGERNQLVQDDLWAFDDLQSTSPRVFVQDHSQYYDVPADHVSAEGFITLGEYSPANQYIVPQVRGGPVSLPPKHTWSEIEIFPENLVGESLALPAGTPSAQLLALRSTFRVVRAVSEQECIGFFDTGNAWDNAFESIGPCHWTLPIRFTNSIGPGELCAFLALFKANHPAVYERLFRFFGVDVSPEWEDSDLRVESQRKYAGWLHVQRPNGEFSDVRLPAENTITSTDRLNVFKSWAWYYRFMMACRTSPELQRLMWTMARIRLRDILTCAWPAGNAPFVMDGGTQLPATIGDVYTSERATALLLRWHVRRPAKVVTPSEMGNADSLAAAYAASGFGVVDVSTFGNTEEQALIQGLYDVLVPDPNNDADHYREVRDWPRWGNNPRHWRLDPQSLVAQQTPVNNPPQGLLSDQRNSFCFADLEADEL